MINLFNTNCMEGMKDYPDKFFDLAIVDPPYGIGDFKNSVGYSRKPYNIDWKIDWNDQCPGPEYFNEIYRVSNNLICWGVNYYSKHIKEVGRIIWDKGNESGIGSACEIASQFRDIRVVKIFIRNTGFCRTEKDLKIHPCQKPVALYKWLLKNYAKPGDKILDTHGGSMSIAIACHDMGHDLWLWELDESYFLAGKERLERHQQQGRLFT